MQSRETMASFVQLNVNRSRAAHDLLWHTSRGSNVFLITEPNKKLAKEKTLICDKNIDGAVIIRNECNDTAVISVFAGEGYVCVEFVFYIVIVCYMSPNVSLRCLELLLSCVGNPLRTAEKPAIIAGDLNSKSPL